MFRTLLVLAAGVGAAASGMTAAHHDHAGGGQVKVTELSRRDIAEKVDGMEAKVTVVELALEPGQAGKPHRHAGPVFGYVLEGEYEWAIDDQPAKVLKAGDTFYEPARCRHPGKVKARVLATVLHPRDGKPITIPEPDKK